MLAGRGADGEWPAGRWTASTWTLLLLVALGVPERHPAAQPELGALVDRFIPPDKEVDGDALLKRVDLCHLGFWLGLSAYYLDPDDPRLLPLAEAILSAQFADGGWNCHMRNHPHRTHSSFHTTFNVLENVRIAVDQGAVPAATFRDAEARAAELMLAAPPLSLGSHGRGHLRAVHPADVPVALALHVPPRPRLPAADPGDHGRAPRRRDRAAC